MRIELDDIQALAYRACSDNTKTQIDVAVGKFKAGQVLLKESKLIRVAAMERMENCWTAISACHGFERLPDEAEIKEIDGRVVITWEFAEVAEVPSVEPPDAEPPDAAKVERQIEVQEAPA